MAHCALFLLLMIIRDQNLLTIAHCAQGQGHDFKGKPSRASFQGHHIQIRRACEFDQGLRVPLLSGLVGLMIDRDSTI